MPRALRTRLSRVSESPTTFTLVSRWKRTTISQTTFGYRILCIRVFFQPHYNSINTGFALGIFPPVSDTNTSRLKLSGSNSEKTSRRFCLRLYLSYSRKDFQRHHYFIQGVLDDEYFHFRELDLHCSCKIDAFFHHSPKHISNPAQVYFSFQQIID